MSQLISTLNAEELTEFIQTYTDDLKAAQERLTAITEWPQVGDPLYTIDPSVGVVQGEFSGEELTLEEMVSTFQTEKEAEKELCRRQATIQILLKVRQLNYGWVPDWGSLTQQKWYIHLNRVTGKVEAYTRTKDSYLPDVYAIRSGKAAQKLIKDHYEALLKILT